MRRTGRILHCRADRLLHRVIMSPHGAKRLHERLSKLIEEYESRHGVLE